MKELIKIYKKQITILLLSFMLSLTACNLGKATPSTDVVPPFLSIETEPLRVILESGISKENEWGYINSVLRGQGFLLEFELYGGEDDFETYVRENINENIIFMPSSSHDLIEELKNAGLLGNFHETGMAYAPNYTMHPYVASRNEPGTLYIMATQFNKITPNFPAVVVREDIAIEYGKEIRTASQYIGLLNLLKEWDPPNIPGMAFAVRPGIFDMMFYDFFMPEYGYWAPMQEFNVVFGIGTNNVYPRYSLLENRIAIEEFTNLWREGLIHVRYWGPQGRQYDEFPTALVYFNDFISPFIMVSEITGISSFDASGYRIYALYGGILPFFAGEGYDYINTSGSRAIAGINTDAREFLRLLEWLKQRENYNLLFYGIEGTDYHIIRDRMVFVENPDVNWAVLRNNLYFLENSDFKPIPSYAPHNIESELMQLYTGYTITVTPEGFRYLNEVRFTSDFLWNMFSETITLARALFEHGRVPTEVNINRLIDDFIQSQYDRRHLIDEYARAWEYLFENAAIR